jgi:glycosyltransferase involved in cell wall biosynthesis
VKLVFVTQRLDPDDRVLGATVPMVRALAERADEVVVLALSARLSDLPPNVRVKVFGAGSKHLRAVRLLAGLVPELRRKPVAVVAHMAPVYAVLAAPFTHARRVPLLLWFTHWRDSRRLRAAERVSTRVLTVAPESFPFHSPKLLPIGHAIDVGEIEVVPREPDGVFRLLALGRTSPAKGLVALVEAVAALGDLPLDVEIRGPSLTEEERRHREELERRIGDLGLADRVRVEPPVDRGEIGSVFARADALVNNMRAGALDKAVYEAAAAGLPVLVASPGFDPLVAGIEPPLRFRQDDTEDLAHAIRRLWDAGPDARRAAGRELRARVEREHSVDHWAERVLAAAG